MNYTIQERKNHKAMYSNTIVFILTLGALGYSVRKEMVILWAISLACIMALHFHAMWIGYCHGWELKRISMEEEN